MRDSARSLRAVPKKLPAVAATQSQRADVSTCSVQVLDSRFMGLSFFDWPQVFAAAQFERLKRLERLERLKPLERTSAANYCCLS